LTDSTKVVRLHPDSIDRGILKQIVACLKKGGLVAFPTETVYGLGGIASLTVRRRLLKLKKGERSRPLGIFVHSFTAVREIASEIPAYAHLLMRKFWPGPLTLVFKSEQAGLRPLLYKKTIGLRIPNQRWLLTLLKKLKQPLLQTSANLSGKPPARSAREVLELFGDEVDLIIEAGKLRKSRPSTVVDVTGPFPIILRRGAFSRKLLEKAIRVKFDVRSE
jgi:L-threonylcarbamoyladenylate synthase